MKKMKKLYPTFDEYASEISALPQLHGGYRTQNRGPACSDIPLVSIVTVTYNAEQTLARTLESVQRQTYRNIEHIIIDGGSTDGTLSLIQANEHSIAYWRSELDQGIYDAFNKGVVLANGEYIGILNADDYYELDQIENAVAVLLRTGAPFVHGDIIMHGWRGLDIPLHGDSDYASKISQGMPALFQVTVLCKAEVFKQSGLFPTRYLVAGDYEWFLRLAKHGHIGVHDPLVRAHMQAGGISTTRQRRAMLEAGHISWRHGLPVGRAVRLTLPRVAFPNGYQHIIARFKQLRQRPRQALHQISQFVLRTLRRANTNAPSQIEADSLLNAFLDARQLCSTITPIGLEWLYGLALRSRTYAIRINGEEEASAVKIMLRAGGSEQVPATAPVDVILCGHENLQIINFDKAIRKKTILLLNSDLIPSSIKAVPHLDFGMLLAFGAHVCPEFSTRRPA